MIEQGGLTALDANLMQSNCITEFLRRAIARKSAKVKIVPTDLIPSILSSTSWANHQNGLKISMGSLNNYMNKLDLSNAEKLKLSALYADHCATQEKSKDFAAKPAKSVLYLKNKLGMDSIDHYSLEGFSLLVNAALDCRQTNIPMDVLKHRINMLQSFLQTHDHDSPVRGTKMLLIAYSVHLNAYYRNDRSLQNRSRGLVRTAAQSHRPCINYYTQAVIEMHWLNKQDMSLLSADMVSQTWRDRMMKKFLEIEINLRDEPTSNQDYGYVIIKNMKFASRYNIVSLGIEVDSDGIDKHLTGLQQIDRFDQEENTPASIAVYNDLSHAEYLIRKQAFLSAIQYCDFAISKYSATLEADSLQVAQLNLKKYAQRICLSKINQRARYCTKK